MKRDAQCALISHNHLWVVVTKAIACVTRVILVQMVEPVFHVLLVNTRQRWGMHCVLYVLQAHTRRKLVRIPMYVLAVLLTQTRKTSVLKKQTADVTRGRQVQMEDHASNVLQENINPTLELANVHCVE